MLDVHRRIQVISALIEQGTPESATYAALECRLAIEYLCYERLQIALDLVSYADLKGWQPGKVVRSVEALANDDVASSFTLMIAAEPELPPGEQLTLEERKGLDYRPIGTQATINLSKIVSLWNALSSAALHVQVPKVKSDALSIYGDVSRTTAKVQECLAELQKISTGTLLTSGFGREVSVSCFGCNYPVKRRIERLNDKQIVSCVNPDCEESYTVEKTSDEEIIFHRRLAFFACTKCETQVEFAMRQLEKMKISDVADVYCSACKAHHRVSAKPVYTTVEDNAGHG